MCFVITKLTVFCDVTYPGVINTNIWNAAPELIRCTKIWFITFWKAIHQFHVVYSDDGALVFCRYYIEDYIVVLRYFPYDLLMLNPPVKNKLPSCLYLFIYLFCKNRKLITFCYRLPVFCQPPIACDWRFQLQLWFPHQTCFVGKSIIVPCSFLYQEWTMDLRRAVLLFQVGLEAAGSVL